MQLAQKLYEAGLITYMRTDSVALSKVATDAMSEYIVKRYGQDYYQFRTFKSKSAGAQEAHEAIRPTNIKVEEAGADAQQRLPVAHERAAPEAADGAGRRCRVRR